MTTKTKEQEEQPKVTLKDPFPSKFVEWKIQATNGDRCMVVAYVDPRHYMVRLDEVDPQWSDDIQIEMGGKFICKLTVNGVTRCSTGEAEKGLNEGTSAEAQAFKRACTKHGLGRYLYFLPRQWVGYNAQTKQFNPDEIKQLPQWALPEKERDVKA